MNEDERAILDDAKLLLKETVQYVEEVEPGSFYRQSGIGPGLRPEITAAKAFIERLSRFVEAHETK